MTLRRTHRCRRCDAPIEPGDRFAALDLLDPDGRTETLLCRDCAVDLREFLGDGSF